MQWMFCDDAHNPFPSYKLKATNSLSPEQYNPSEVRTTMNDARDVSHVERFTPKDLENLRDRLSDASLDSFQGAEIVASFLNGRGYGVSNQEARLAVLRIDTARWSAERVQAELERVARVM